MVIIAEAWFDSFRHTDPDQFEAAVKAHRDRGDFFPKPSDIRRLINEIQARPKEVIPEERRLEDRPADRKWLREHLRRFRMKSIPGGKSEGLSPADRERRKEILRRQAKIIQDGGLDYGD